MSNLIAIVLLQSVSGPNYNYSRGDEVEVASDVAIDLIAAAHAKPAGKLTTEQATAVNDLIEARKPKVVEADEDAPAPKAKRERR